MVDPVPSPSDERAEAAYREALLADDTGRDARRARLMAALPRPNAAAPSVVAPNVLANAATPWASTWVWALVATGLMLTVLVVLKGRGTGASSGPDPRLVAAASAPAASAAPSAVVVAQAERTEAPPVAARRDRPVAAAKAAPRRDQPARTAPAAPVVIADAAPPPAGGLVASAETPTAAAPAAPVTSAPAAPAAALPAPLAERSNAWHARAKASSFANSLAASPAIPEAAGSDVQPGPAALLEAITRGDIAGARAAVQAGVSVHARDPQGRTALMLAARGGSRALVALLLAEGARPADRDAKGWRAVDHALDQGHADLLDLLPPG